MGEVDYLGLRKNIYNEEDMFCRVEKHQGRDYNYFFLKDHLGSTRAVLQEDAVYGDYSVVDRYYEYKSYGDMLLGSVTWDQPRKFTGKLLDKEAGMNLYYFGARYYNAAVWRWLSPDPLLEKYPSQSPYAYCAGSPVSVALLAYRTPY
jgi:RHS repeat-associated protein